MLVDTIFRFFHGSFLQEQTPKIQSQINKAQDQKCLAHGCFLYNEKDLGDQMWHTHICGQQSVLSSPTFVLSKGLGGLSITSDFP